MLEETIVAIATAPGPGAVAIVRLAGPGAFAVAARIAPGFDAARPREARLLRLVDAAGGVLDRALVTGFRGPHSFTGDDVVEFATHGGALAPAAVMAACLQAGARQALPGEFARRAVFNGKLDLLQAEAVGDLVAATAPEQGRVAVRQLEGGLSRRINELRELLLEAESLLAYAIDFPEEDDGPIDPRRVTAALASLEAAMTRLLESAGDGERLRRGALVVLAGAPNAGKSSLFNALLGRDRALVTEIAGTTRDAIEADLSIDGWPVRLVDTAGLRESTDRLERLGIDVSRRYLAEADLVILCVGPGDGALAGDPFGATPVLTVATKSDLPGPVPGVLAVSAVTGEGLGALRGGLVDRLFGAARRSRGDEAMLTAVRHRIAVERALEETRQAGREIDAGEPVLAAHRLRGAVLALDELIGVVDREEIFDRVFSGFCIGK